MDQDPPPNPHKKDKKRKGRVIAPVLPVPRPTNPIPPTVNWADEVEEINRLIRKEQLASHTARAGPTVPAPLGAQPAPLPPLPPPLPLPPPPGSDPNPANFVPSVGIYDKRPKAAVKTNPPPTMTQAPKPYRGVSYTAAARAAPKEANEWTKVPVRGRGA